jgi:hypothetical protein
MAYFDALVPEGADPHPAQAEYEALLARGGPAYPMPGDPIDPSESGPLGPFWPRGKAPRSCVAGRTREAGNRAPWSR